MGSHNGDSEVRDLRDMHDFFNGIESVDPLKQNGALQGL